MAFAGHSRRRLIVVDSRVNELFGADVRTYLSERGLHGEIVVVPGTERRKDLGAIVRLAEEFDAFMVDRREEPVIVIGGGVVMDIVGLATSIYRRGTPYIRVPTTLIGLVDAGVGVKTGVNHNGHRNRLGSYHAPAEVLLDPGFLRTLPLPHIRSGTAEIAKIALACDGGLWDCLLVDPSRLITSRLGTDGSDEILAAAGREVLAGAVEAMLTQLHANLWEHDLQRLADFGHTFSPALEMSGSPRLLHGEAVAVDMALCAAIAQNRGLLAVTDRDAILDNLGGLGLPRSHPAITVGFLSDALAETTRHRGGRQRIPVPVEPGHMTFLDDVDVTDLAAAIDVTAARPDGAGRAVS